MTSHTSVFGESHWGYWHHYPGPVVFKEPLRGLDLDLRASTPEKMIERIAVFEPRLGGVPIPLPLLFFNDRTPPPFPPRSELPILGRF